MMILNLQSIHKKYDKRDILKDLSLQVSKGETIAITGPSGSGKTTLLNLIGGLDTPDSGTILFNNTELNKLSKNELAEFRNTKIGFIFQMHYLLPQCTVLENVLIPTLALKDKTKKNAATEKALKLIERAGLTNQKDQIPAELSGGECQRVAFIRALINDPEIILADEPTGSLDQETAAILSQFLIDLNQEQGTTLIVVTHSTELANKMQNVYQINEAKLVKK